MAFAKGLTLRMGQTHVHKYSKVLLDRIQHDGIDPSFIITNRLKLEEAPAGYKLFNEQKGQCIKIVLEP
jgi:threonine dehydrogenase-like Zn-dependent dehydrogenase